MKNLNAYQITLAEHIRTTTRRPDFELLRVTRHDVLEGLPVGIGILAVVAILLAL
jgi:hypothetical protein